MFFFFDLYKDETLLKCFTSIYFFFANKKMCIGLNEKP